MCGSAQKRPGALSFIRDDLLESPDLTGSREIKGMEPVQAGRQTFMGDSYASKVRNTAHRQRVNDSSIHQLSVGILGLVAPLQKSNFIANCNCLGVFMERGRPNAADGNGRVKTKVLALNPLY